jgi:bacterioferritin-associated ferredoxin
MYLCICNNITEADLKEKPELKESIGSGCGTCLDNKDSLELTEELMVDIELETFKEQVLTGWSVAELMDFWECSRTKIMVFKKKHNLTNLSPKDKQKGKKTCNNCSILKPLKDFYSNGYTPKGRKKYKARCKPCELTYNNNQHYIKVTQVLKEQSRKYECERCGYNKNYSALAFHHFTGEKNFDISSSKTRSKDKLREELIICELLCQNCHNEEHNPQLNIAI